MHISLKEVQPINSMGPILFDQYYLENGTVCKITKKWSCIYIPYLMCVHVVQSVHVQVN